MAAGLAGIGTLTALWYFTDRVPPVPRRPLRIGFEYNPPVQVRTESGYSGLSVETVAEAAKRAGIALQWVETGLSSNESLRRGVVDLWPLMVDLPDRRSFVHFAQPWMHSSYVLLLAGDTPRPSREFRGHIAVFDLPLHVRLVREQFPSAQVLQVPVMSDVAGQVCRGAAAAAFFEARAAQSILQDKPAECASSVLRAQMIPDLRLQAGVASTFGAAGAAERIQREIGNMFRDGTLSVLIAKYSYFGLDDTWASYERIEAEQHEQWLMYVGGGLIFAIGVTLWLATSLRQRKHTERALRESEERFRTLANIAPVMIVASGASGHATFFNKTWLDFTGRTMEQELGYGWTESVHPEDRERALATYSSSFTSRGHCKIEYRLRRVDGEYRHVMCNGVPRFEPDGAFGGYIASCVDLTDIRSAEEEARERQNLESLGILAGGIAHDFNNLLGGALAYTELAQARLAEGESPNDELQQIGAVAIRGAEIVRQLMLFAGKEHGDPEAVDVSSLVSEMLELLKVSISKHAVLETSLPEGLPLIRGNAAQIRQVLMNLVTNASEAIGDRDGTIRVVTEVIQGVESSKEGGCVRLQVSDTGCGMTPETQRKAFDPFYTTKFAGRGMGLAVVQRVVRELGGTIHVASTLGHGTTIQVTLPCVFGATAVKDRGCAGSKAYQQQPFRGRTILIVEDEQALSASISKCLQRAGISVMQAADGSAGLELIRSHPDQIDAMLLDFSLPGVPSRTVFEEALRLRPDLVMIVTSAYSRESISASFDGLVVENFLRKPFHLDELVTVLQERLSVLPLSR